MKLKNRQKLTVTKTVGFFLLSLSKKLNDKGKEVKTY